MCMSNHIHAKVLAKRLHRQAYMVHVDLNLTVVRGLHGGVGAVLLKKKKA